ERPRCSRPGPPRPASIGWVASSPGSWSSRTGSSRPSVFRAGTARGSRTCTFTSSSPSTAGRSRAPTSSHATSLDGPPGRPSATRSAATATIARQRFERADWTMLFGVYLWNGVVFLAAGLLAWSLSPLRPLPRAFLAFGASCALFLFTAMDLYGPWTFFDLHLLSEALVPAAGLQLLLLFPVEHRL